MTNILVVGDDPTLSTGYARVARFVASMLAKNGYRVRYLPCNATQPNADRTQFPFELDSFDTGDRYGVHRIGPLLNAFRPALTMVFGEFAYVGYIGNACRSVGLKALYYYPVEGDNYPPAVVYLRGGHVDYRVILQRFHYIVAYSEFGAKNINKTLPGIVTDTIPHQVDTKVFRPLDKEACRKIFFPPLVENPGLDKIFVVGHVGRNQERKGTDLVLQGFAHFLHNHASPELQPYLFLNLDPKDDAGYNLYALAEELNLGGHIIINPIVGGKQGPEDNQLCEIYNTFDLHLAPHRAEGFGLNVLESMACGVQNLTTAYATPPEFAGETAEYFKPSWFSPRPNTGCMWAVINPKDIGEAINRVYLRYLQNPDIRQKPHTPSVIVAKAYDETRVAARWLKLLADMKLPDQGQLESTVSTKSQLDTMMDDYMGSVVG